MLLGLTTAQKFGLAGVAFVFVTFSLVVSMLIPRYRPDFPGRRHLGLFIAVTIALVIAMLAAVEVFAVESEEEPREESPAAIEQPEESEPAPPSAEPAPPAAETPAPAEESGETTLENPADPSQLRFRESTLEAPTGEITLVMDNPSPIEHNIAVRGDGIDERGDIVGQGEESEVTVDLDAGEYEFYCSVPGHEEAGMKGTLTVTG